MSRILVVGCPTDGNVIVTLDDPAVYEDEGEAYDAYFVIGPVDFGRAGPSGKLRRVVQSVSLGGSTATVTITPLADDQTFDDQAYVETVIAAEGVNQRVQANPAVRGQRFQYRVDVSDFDGSVEFGEADIAMIPERTSR